MKFHYKNPLYLNVLIILLALIQAGLIFLNIAKFAGWFGLTSNFFTVEVAQIVLGVFILIICTFLMLINYRIEDDRIKIIFWFIDITGGKYLISKVRAVIKRSENNGLYVSIYTTDVEPIIIKISIDAAKYDKFTRCLQEKNPLITIVEN